MLIWWCLVLALAGAESYLRPGCQLNPGPGFPPKTPGDNSYRLIVNGEVERYAPRKRYVVTLLGPRPYDNVQQFTRYRIIAQSENHNTSRSPSKTGEYQLFSSGSVTDFDMKCLNQVVQPDDRPKTEVQVSWKAPASGSGCILLKAMVYENESRWYAEDGQLTRRICEDTSLLLPDCCACNDANYKMVFEGLWSAKTHPKDFPVQAAWLTHFSDVIGATHPRNFSFWGPGLIASDGFRSLAEWGSVGLLERELRQQGKMLRSIVKAQGLWYPKVNTNTSGAFTVDRHRHYLSLASMFGPSPDWVVGVSGLELCNQDCSWVENKTVDLFPYDAGTDDGISYMSPNAETIPRERMYRITTMYPEDPRAPFYNPRSDTMQPLARLHLHLSGVVDRGCDDETLRAMIVSEAENTETANKPECAVEEWGAWTPCSVSCGKGLRMRTRAYRLPQKAAMFNCSRQLVSKEMCVSPQPECPAHAAEAAEDLTTPLGEEHPECATSQWGPWSECSVTCGIGVSTRRRSFLDHMGLKKCPLVPVEENRKCMEPQCLEAEQAVSDPACPTTDWSGWSPCSASCGHGVRFRTRLLLVPPERQQDCSSKVELLQQRPCHERDDCNIDMLTAKRICMEAPEQGPCRGMYPRWAFAAAKGMCVPFNYGGCRGNQNNFLTQEDCTNTCKVILGAAGVGGVGSTSPLLATLNGGGGAAGGGGADGAGGAEGAGSAAGDQACRLGAWSAWSPCMPPCTFGWQHRVRKIVSPAVGNGKPCSLLRMRRRKCSRLC